MAATSGVEKVGRGQEVAIFRQMRLQVLKFSIFHRNSALMVFSSKFCIFGKTVFRQADIYGKGWIPPLRGNWTWVGSIHRLGRVDWVRLIDSCGLFRITPIKFKFTEYFQSVWPSRTGIYHVVFVAWRFTSLRCRIFTFFGCGSFNQICIKI